MKNEEDDEARERDRETYLVWLAHDDAKSCFVNDVLECFRAEGVVEGDLGEGVVVVVLVSGSQRERGI